MTEACENVYELAARIYLHGSGHECWGLYDTPIETVGIWAEQLEVAANRMKEIVRFREGNDE